MTEISSTNPPPIFPIVPAPAPRPKPAPELETEAEEPGIEAGVEEGTEVEEIEAPRSKVDDGISDLFEGPEDETEDIDELFEVTQEDIIGDEDGDLSDLTEVKREDVMGRPPKMKAKRASRPSRPAEGGMQGVGY